MLEYIQSNFLDLSASIIGLLFLYFEFKANINMWIVSILMAVLFIFMFWSSHLYASMCIYIYFLLASIYGRIMWLRDRKHQKTEDDIIYRLPVSLIWKVLVSIIIAFGLIYLLFYYTEYQNVGFRIGDAFATSLNVVSLWMLSRKWAEQWLLLIPANIISGMLLYYEANYASSMMFFIYAIVSLIGFFYWCRLVKRDKNEK